MVFLWRWEGIANCFHCNKVFYTNGVGRGNEPPNTWSSELAPSLARQLLCFACSLQLLHQLVMSEVTDGGQSGF